MLELFAGLVDFLRAVAGRRQLVLGIGRGAAFFVRLAGELGHVRGELRVEVDRFALGHDHRRRRGAGVGAGFASILTTSRATSVAALAILSWRILGETIISTRISDPIVDIKTSRKANSPTDVSWTAWERRMEPRSAIDQWRQERRAGGRRPRAKAVRHQSGREKIRRLKNSNSAKSTHEDRDHRSRGGERPVEARTLRNGSKPGYGNIFRLRQPVGRLRNAQVAAPGPYSLFGPISDRFNESPDRRLRRPVYPPSAGPVAYPVLPALIEPRRLARIRGYPACQGTSRGSFHFGDRMGTGNARRLARDGEIELIVR